MNAISNLSASGRASSVMTRVSAEGGSFPDHGSAIVERWNGSKRAGKTIDRKNRCQPTPSFQGTIHKAATALCMIHLLRCIEYCKTKCLPSPEIGILVLPQSGENTVLCQTAPEHSSSERQEAHQRMHAPLSTNTGGMMLFLHHC